MLDSAGISVRSSCLWRCRNEWNITGDILLDGEDESQGSLSVCHFLPHKTKGEGFFLAALRKPDAEDEPAAYSFSKAKASKKKDKKGGAAASPVSKEHMRMALNWLKQENVEKYTLSAEGAGIVAFPQRYTDELAADETVSESDTGRRSDW